MNKFITVKLWVSTHKLAKILAATLDETLSALLDRLVRQEFIRKNITVGIGSTDIQHRQVEEGEE